MKQRHKIFLVILIIFTLGLIIPQDLKMPVSNAKSSDYNEKSFWYYPWGKSVTHKGVDIFAKKGTKIHSATKGFVIYAGQNKIGGNIILALGPKWRLHYYAHLDQLNVGALSLVNKKSQIGTVGTSGNAGGKQPHLHYSILTMIPYVWKADNTIQGWKKMFYLNPIQFLNKK